MPLMGMMYSLIVNFLDIFSPTYVSHPTVRYLRHHLGKADYSSNPHDQGLSSGVQCQAIHGEEHPK